jgi:replication factor A1
MGVIEDAYADLDTDVSEADFREAVASKVEQMGGLADEETAAMLIAHELDEGEVEGIADIEPGMEEVKFLGKVVRIGDIRNFERDGDDPEGKVLNVEVADETGPVRIALWDEAAASAAEGLEDGDVLRIKGRPNEGYNGLEISVDQVEIDEDVEIEVPDAEDSISGLALGRSDVTVDGVVLDTGTVRTFDRDDGSEGKVANFTLGDETDRIRVTLWGERTDRVEELAAGETVEVVDGYVRERNGDLELHVGSRGAVEAVDADVEYVPDTTPITDLEIGETTDIAGVIRSADPKRTFDRDDGSEGQVRNVRVQDGSGDIRVALWSEKADYEIGPGDEVAFADVEIQDGWRDDMEASAGWRSSVTRMDNGSTARAGSDGRTGGETGTEAGAGTDGEADVDTAGASGADSASSDGLSAFADGTAPERENTESNVGDDADDTDVGIDYGVGAGSGPIEEITGTVVQAGSPVIVDSGERTIRFDAEGSVGLGETVTVRGRSTDDGFELDELDARDRPESV